MAQDLFLDKDIKDASSMEAYFGISKEAREILLEEDASTWPVAVLQQLYKELEFLADFDAEVKTVASDKEKGTGLGFVEVRTKTIDPNRKSQSRMVRIPYIIKNRRLMPMDIMLTENGKAVPLTEKRLRSAMFRPDVFDLTRDTTGDLGMVGMLYPPSRQDAVGRGTWREWTKEGSARAIKIDPKFPGEDRRETGPKPLYIGIKKPDGRIRKHASALATILPYIEEEDYVRFTKELQNVKTASITHNPSFVDAIRILGKYSGKLEKVAGKLGSAVVATQVAPISNVEYVIKVAYANGKVEENVVDRNEVVKLVGTKKLLEIDRVGSSTDLGRDPVAQESANASVEVPIENYGFGK